MDDFGQVANFTLTDRSGKAVRRADLDGKVWVAGFVFTSCGGPCPQVSATMARLQKELADQPDFRLVTFTVDPERDTPEVLTRYAEQYKADPDRWFFLTGKQDAVYALIKESFKLGVEQAQGSARQPGSEVTHSTRLALVDRHGHVRGYYEGRQTDEQGAKVDDVPRLVRDAKTLLREK
jgi:cytochrome oxidase Cu insertion factor (SCO1/SenC/PrrC family)